MCGFLRAPGAVTRSQRAKAQSNHTHQRLEPRSLESKRLIFVDSFWSILEFACWWISLVIPSGCSYPRDVLGIDVVKSSSCGAGTRTSSRTRPVGQLSLVKISQTRRAVLIQQNVYSCPSLFNRNDRNPTWRLYKTMNKQQHLSCLPLISDAEG